MSPFFLSPTTAIINVLLPTLMSLIPDDIMQSALDKLLDSIVRLRRAQSPTNCKGPSLTTLMASPFLL